ncbi:two-partner secretion domain-containing protein [Yersinia aldovae]|uniref:two-partner secretion domain-containing protein n=1 Tax=Yersinia aldovae TaxID=29483 RepID=UPI0011AAB240|nr:filamentous hemagglutinin N-terminal domain-containing protein [Yersinia aldovae]
MNSTLYKLIFCRRLGCLIAVGEFTRSYGRSFSPVGGKRVNDYKTKARVFSRLVMLMGIVPGTLSPLVFAHPPLPANGNIVVGQGVLDANNTTLTVMQQSDKLAINWGSFDIAQGNSVIYNQPGTQSIALNRVLGRDASQIYGNLKANGQVFLLNPNGILFGKGAQVDVGGLVASTKSMSNHDFINGSYTLTSLKSEGQVINQANLRTTAGGYIALIGQQVDNQASGVINAPQGKVALVSASRVTLNLDHGSLLGVQVQGEQVSALLKNGGLIQANEGVIQLTARGKEMLMNTVIDNTGILRAQGLSEKNGVIFLDGGSEGGVVRQQGMMDVSSSQGYGGYVILQGENIHLVAGSKIDAQGSIGGGNVLVGGGWQGKNSRIRNSRSVVMDKSANIDVSSSNKGAGGTAVLWSEYYTGFYGDIHARGGSQSGDGGQVETSSRRNLQAFGHVDTATIHGRRGRWLLDPAEVNIVSSGTETGALVQIGNIPAGYATNTQIFTPTANIAQILNSSINAQLNNGTDVTITTSNSSLLSCRWCNITLQADINKTAGGNATLTLHADGNIVSDSNITSTAGRLNLNLLAGNTTVDSVITLNNSYILLNGGDLLAKHANENNTARIELIGGRYDVGNLTLNGNTGAASQVGVNISHAANITAAGEVHISGESSNANEQGWRGVDISDGSSIVSAGDMIFEINSNSKIAWMGAFNNVSIVSGKDLAFKANGNAWGGIVFKNSKVTANSGDLSFSVNGDVISGANKGIYLNASHASGENINIKSHVTGADAFLLFDGSMTATSGNINANVTTTHKGIWISGNSSVNAHKDINMKGITTGMQADADGINISGNTSNYVNIKAGANIAMVGSHSGQGAGASIVVDYANIETGNGNFTANAHGVKSMLFSNANVTANGIEVNSDATGADGIVLEGGNFTSTAGSINFNATAMNNGVFIKPNSSLNAQKNITLIGVGEADGVIIQGDSVGARNNITAQGDVTILGKNSTGSHSSINLSNLSLISESKNIDINGSSVGMGSIYINNIDFNASLGNVSIYAETNSPLASSQSAALILEGNNTLVAKNGSFTGNALNITQGVGIGFRSGNTFSVDGNVAFHGVTDGVDTASRGIDFHGSNTFNIAKGSQLAFLGENKGASDTTGGDGITHSGATMLTINNNGSLTMEGRSSSGTGINFPTSNNTVILHGEGDTLIKGSSIAGTGVSLSGIVNNSSGPVTLVGASTNGTGVHLFSAEHQINRINVTGHSAHAEGLRMSGNTTITDTTLTGKSINGSGVTVDSLPGSSGVANTILDNTTLNGRSNNGIGMEITRDINGINQSTINGITDGIGYGINIKENINVTGTSQADLLTINGIAITGSGDGIKLNGNNDLSNTSLYGSAVDGIGLDISGSLTDGINTGLTGTASGAGIGVQVNGSLSESVVNGTSASGIGVQVKGTFDDSRINGVSASGSGVKVDGETVLNNTVLMGNSAEGKGVEISGDLIGDFGSTVHGDTVNGTGVYVSHDLNLTSDGTGGLLIISSNATGEQGSGVMLMGNNTLDNIKLSGNATAGIGININGPFTHSGNTTVDGKATDGDGIQLNGAVAGGRIEGGSTNGRGINVSGDSSLNNAILNGNSINGKGVEIAGNLASSNGSAVYGDTVNGTGVEVDISTHLNGGDGVDLLVISGNAHGEKGTGVTLDGFNILDNTSLAGNATNGTGIDISGLQQNEGNTTIVGKAVGGNGVQLAGAVSGAMVSGISDMGSGIKVDGNTQLHNATLNGSSTDGRGMEIVGNLSGAHGSVVQGNTTNGIGVYVGKDATLSGGGEDDSLQVSGNAHGEQGIGVTLGGFNILDNTSLNGNATDGHGVELSGPVTNSGNTTVNGIASNSGHGVHVNGTVSGGAISGNSGNNHGVLLNDAAIVSDIMIGGSSTMTRKLSVLITLPESVGENVTINGQAVDKNNLADYTVADSIVTTNTSVNTTVNTTVNTNTAANTQAALISPERTTTVAGATVMPLQEGSQPDLLLIKRNQILSSFEGHTSPAPIVIESEHDISANISVDVCLPEGVNTPPQPCDTHVLGRWKPLPAISDLK